MASGSFDGIYPCDYGHNHRSAAARHRCQNGNDARGVPRNARLAESTVTPPKAVGRLKIILPGDPYFISKVGTTEHGWAIFRDDYAADGRRRGRSPVETGLSEREANNKAYALNHPSEKA